MNNQIYEVMLRRSELLLRIAKQRDEVVDLSSRWQTPFSLADQTLEIMRFFRAHLALTTGIVALITIRRRGLFGLLKIVWRGWRLYRLAKTFAVNLPVRF
jgi:YqjK-like protein